MLRKFPCTINSLGMKVYWGLFVSFFLLIFCSNAEQILTIDEKHPVPIVLPESSTEAEKTAAKELKKYLYKLTGANCSIVEEGAIKDRAIYVGQSAFARQAGIRFDSLGREEWILKTHKGNLILAGGRPRGTLYGVYQFLEKQGIVWPDEVSEYIPPKKTLKIDEMSVRMKPIIPFRRMTNGFSSMTDKGRIFFIRCGRNDVGMMTVPAYGIGEYFGGCHTFHSYTDKSWPNEWFAMNASGKRIRSTSGSGPGQFCLTNPEVRKAVIAKLRNNIKKDRAKYTPESWPRIYDISHNDNMNKCLCPSCKAVMEREGAYSGVLLDFINAVANDIAKDYPDILIQTFAYTFTLDAPKHIRPAKNVLIRICKLGIEHFPGGSADTMFPNSHPSNRNYLSNFLKWSAISKQIAVWDYWVLYSTPFKFPYMNLINASKDVRFYRDNNVKNIFVQSEYPEERSFSHFTLWFGYKIMINPDLSYEELADRFCNAYYGKAAGVMRQYMDYLQKRQNAANTTLGKTGVMTIPYLDRKFFVQVNKFLDEAERLVANDPVALKHVGYERIPVDISLLHLRKRFGKNIPTGILAGGSLKKLFARYEKNLLDHAAIYYKDGIAYKPNPQRYQSIVKRLSAQRAAFLDSDNHLLAKFRGRKVIDINWTFGNAKRLVPDPEGAYGYALQIPNKNQKNYHRLPFKLGLYDRFGNKDVIVKSLSLANIPQDGKFHLISLGKHVIKPGFSIWFHWSWLIELKIDLAYNSRKSNIWEVFVSLKLDGKPYIKNSVKKPVVRVDRILLVR